MALCSTPGFYDFDSVLCPRSVAMAMVARGGHQSGNRGELIMSAVHSICLLLNSTLWLQENLMLPLSGMTTSRLFWN